MDYRSKYFQELIKITSILDHTIANEIYYDLSKLEVWYLPELDELKYYLDALMHIEINEWKIILQEFKRHFHCPIRNELLVDLIKGTRKFNHKIKPFKFYEYISFNSCVNRKEFIRNVKLLKEYSNYDYIYSYLSRNILNSFRKETRI